MLKNVGENIKKNFAVIFFYTMVIKNTIFNTKFYQHFLPSLVISDLPHNYKFLSNSNIQYNVFNL